MLNVNKDGEKIVKPVGNLSNAELAPIKINYSLKLDSKVDEDEFTHPTTASCSTDKENQEPSSNNRLLALELSKQGSSSSNVTLGPSKSILQSKS